MKAGRRYALDPQAFERNDTLPLMKAENKHPFELLGPTRMLDGLQSLGLQPDGRLLALNSFENRVYLLWLDEPWLDPQGHAQQSVVLKAYRPGRWSLEQILEEHAFARDLADAELPVAAPINLRESFAARDLPGDTLMWIDPVFIALWPRQGGRAPDMDRPDVIERMGRFIARLHLVGRQRVFRHRLGFRGLASAFDAVDQVEALSASLPEACHRWLGVARGCLKRAQSYVADLPTPRLLRLHGDMHWGNVLWTEAGPHFVDLDDCRMGPAISDLWPLLSGQGEELEAGLRILLQAYCSISEFDPMELHWIEVMRSMRLIEHTAWIAHRYDDPAFPRAFPGFADPDFWDRRMVELQQQESQLRLPR